MQDVYLSNDQYEALENKNGDCIIKDRSNGKYFFEEKLFISKKHDFSIVKPVHWDIKDSIFATGIVLSLIAFIYLFFLKYNGIFNANIYFSNAMYVKSAIYLIVGVIAHEAAHFLTMIFYGRKPGKIKIKHYFIFVYIVTTTTDSYLLPRYRRAFVYYAGIMANLIMYGATLLLIPSVAYLLRAVLWNVLYNLIPFGGLKTDGYHIFVNTVLNIKEVKNQKNIVVEIFKYIFIVFAIVTFSDSILTVFGFGGLYTVLRKIVSSLIVLLGFKGI